MSTFVVGEFYTEESAPVAITDIPVTTTVQFPSIGYSGRYNTDFPLMGPWYAKGGETILSIFMNGGASSGTANVKGHIYQGSFNNTLNAMLPVTGTSQSPLASSASTNINTDQIVRELVLTVPFVCSAGDIIVPALELDAALDINVRIANGNNQVAPLGTLADPYTSANGNFARSYSIWMLIDDPNRGVITGTVVRSPVRS